MIEEHHQRTDSEVAARVLARWDELLDGDAFVKVMPHDYRRVLRELAEEEARAASADNNGTGAQPDALRPLDATEPGDTRSAPVPEPASGTGA